MGGRRGEEAAAGAAVRGRRQGLGHDRVIGELACGLIPDRTEVPRLLAQLPQAKLAVHDEVLRVIEMHDVAGSRIGYVDAHLLASTLLTPDARLWTRDRRLASVAARLGLAWVPPGRA